MENPGEPGAEQHHPLLLGRIGAAGQSPGGGSRAEQGRIGLHPTLDRQ